MPRIAGWELHYPIGAAFVSSGSYSQVKMIVSERKENGVIYSGVLTMGTKRPF